MQAIETKFVGPTNHRSARIRVRCQARTMFVSWDHSLGVEGNHDAAARCWQKSLAGAASGSPAAMPTGSGNVYVNVTNDNDRRSSSRIEARRVQIPAYTDRWMMGDRFGELIKITRKNGEKIAHVRLDKSSKIVRVVLADCEIVS